VPTLFLVGSEDPLCPFDLARRASELVSGSSVEIIEGAGHSAYFEKPEEFNDVVRRFFAEH
jgi:pimeloyl-ACP methyl ester carboxylesterase